MPTVIIECRQVGIFVPWHGCQGVVVRAHPLVVTVCFVPVKVYEERAAAVVPYVLTLDFGRVPQPVSVLPDPNPVTYLRVY